MHTGLSIQSKKRPRLQKYILHSHLQITAVTLHALVSCQWSACSDYIALSSLVKFWLLQPQHILVHVRKIMLMVPNNRQLSITIIIGSVVIIIIIIILKILLMVPNGRGCLVQVIRQSSSAAGLGEHAIVHSSFKMMVMVMPTEMYTLMKMMMEMMVMTKMMVKMMKIALMVPP